jgi:uncharacterized protein (TIGR03437 family)
VLLVAALAVPADAQRLIVLPGAANPASQASAFSADPLAFVGTINAAPRAFLAFGNPAGTRYYIITTTGVVVVDSSGAQVQTPLAIPQPVTAAALSPDGHWLLVAAGDSSAGNLYLFDASGSTISQVAAPPVGADPSGVAVSPDSSRAFVATSAGLTPVDLSTKAAGTTIPLAGMVPSGGAKPGIAIGPNGLLYVNAQSAVYVIHPTTLLALATITVPAAYPSALSFSPDGTMAAAGNQNLGDPVAIVFDLVQNSVMGTMIGLNVQMRQAFFANAQNVYSLGSNGYLYRFAPQTANAPSTPSFGAIGVISTGISGVLSKEPSGAKDLYVTRSTLGGQVDVARLTLAASAATSVPGTTPAGPVFLLSPANTLTATTDLIPFNANQTLVAGATSLPLQVVAVDANGRPVANQAITWNAPDVTLQSQMTATNSQGIAVAIAVAPAASGLYAVTAAVPGPGAPSAAFTLNVGTGEDGGGGEPPAPEGGIAMVSGNGQVVRSYFFTSEPMVVRVVDDDGAPAPNVAVTFATASGGGIPITNFVDPGQNNCTLGTNSVICMTDANGIASAFFMGATVEYFSGSYALSTVTASIPGGSTTPSGSVTFSVTSVPATGPSGIQAMPAVNQLVPPLMIREIEAQQGQTLSGAFRVRVIAQSGIQFGTPIPNVGLSVEPMTLLPTGFLQYILGAAGPAYCVGRTVLTDADGLASCDLFVPATTPAGTYTIYRVVGGYEPLSYTLNVTVAPPEIASLAIVSGDGQSGSIGQTLPNPLVVLVRDQFGNPMAGVSVQWVPVVAGTATLANTTTQTGANGRASNTVTLGNVPGAVQIQASAGGTSVTFGDLEATVTLTSLTKVGNGDNQTAVTNSAFTNPLTVQVNGTLGPMPNMQVTFSVLTGSATLVGGPVVYTNSQGQARINLKAGAQAGPVEIVAAVAGLSSQTFNLNVRSPGPQLTLDSFTNGASFQTGFGFGSVVSIIAPGLTTGLNMPAGSCISAGVEAGPLPTRLAGMEFQFGSLLAPIFAICLNADGSEQANVQAPFELAPATISVTVRSGAGTANPVNTAIDGVTVRNALPGIFEYLAGAQRVAVAVRVSDGSYIGPGNAAHPGDEIRVYVTGMGPVQPWVPTNRPGVGGQVMYFTPLVTLGGTPMGGVRAEYAENMVGIFVITFQIPSNQPTGAAVSLTVGVLTDQGATVTSLASRIAIQ